MAISKVVYKSSPSATPVVWMDTTQKTVTSASMLNGTTALKNDGTDITGNIQSQAAQTIHPSTSDQTIASGKYLSGTQTIKAVTLTNLTADNIKSGVVVKVGDSTDDDCVTSVTGTYTGGGGGLSWSDLASGAQPSGSIDLGSATFVRDYFMYYNQTANEWTVTGNSVTSVGQNCFRMNTYLKAAYFPALTSMSGSGYLFYGSSRLTTVDLGTVDTIRPNCFNNCSALNVLILRRTTITALQQTQSFNGTPFASGGTGGTIYIPKVLYDHLGDGTSYDYKAATNWSTVDGYGTITWAKIEGSIYEL